MFKAIMKTMPPLYFNGKYFSSKEVNLVTIKVES